MQAPRLVQLPPLRLIGMGQRMTRANDATAQLWSGFMPRRHEIEGRSDDKFYSVQRFDPALDFAVNGSDTGLDTEFEKWAAVAVDETATPPAGMEVLQLHGGLYAVFRHRGPASDATRTWQFIFGAWLPASDYRLDQREHFEILPPGYRPDDPAAEEEVWIPIVAKARHGPG